MEKLKKICKIILDNPEIELKVLKKKIKHKPQDLEDLKTHLIQYNLFLSIESQPSQGSKQMSLDTKSSQWKSSMTHA